ncbi:MAG TPA: PaaI family thioesterase [Acidimicrobiales bacterium]|nr:PaaI family thioesterase [Acidimicrobiales bacterium]
MTALGEPTGHERADEPRADEPRAEDGPASPARMETAAALRRLGHAIVAHEVDDDTFHRMTAEVRALLAVVDAMAPRHRTPLDVTHRVFVVPPPDGASRSHFPDCIVTGQANPMGMAADIVRDGDEAVLRTTLGPAFEGAPGRAHGGAVAALFDEVMGFVLSIQATPAYTGRLTVTYRAATPLDQELELRAKLHSRHGRKLRIEAHARQGETLLAEADGLFVAVDPERFAAG